MTEPRRPSPEEVRWLLERAGVRATREDVERVAAIGRYASGIRPEVTEEPFLVPQVGRWRG